MNERSAPDVTQPEAKLLRFPGQSRSSRNGRPWPTPLFLIASDPTKMEADTNVSKSDVGGIKDAQRSTFTVEAFPNRTFA